MTSWNRLIAVVPTSALDRIPIPIGFTAAEWDVLSRLLILSEFQRRSEELERDERWQQLIPYLVVYNGEGHVFRYRRRRDHQEERLANQHSIGIGGHVEQADARENELGVGDLLRAAERELREELAFDELAGLRFQGFLRRTAHPVDRVHLGLIFTTTITGYRGIGGELAEGKFEKPAEIISAAHLVEGWSQELLPYLATITRP